MKNKTVKKLKLKESIKDEIIGMLFVIVPIITLFVIIALTR